MLIQLEPDQFFGVMFFAVLFALFVYDTIYASLSFLKPKKKSS